MSPPAIDSGLHLVGEDEIYRLEELVTHRLNGRLRDFRIAAEREGLVLSGHVMTYYAKQLAQHALMAATSLRIAANDIEVS